MAKKVKWVPFAIVGAAAAGLGAALWAHNKQPNSTPPTQPPPVPPVTPPSSTSSSAATTNDILTALVTDPIVVRQFQTDLASAIAQGRLPVGLTSNDYNTNDVDGNPNNPRFVRAIAIVQAYLNQHLTNTPAGFPSSIRTDGVLDNATYQAISHS